MHTHMIFNVSASGDKLFLSSPHMTDFSIGMERGEATDGDILALLEQTLMVYLMCKGYETEPQTSINLHPGPDLKDGTEIHISFVPSAPQPLPN